MKRWPIRVAVFLALLSALPLLWMALASLTPESRLFDSAAIWRGPFVVDHYRALFDERDFWIPIRNSLIVAGATTVFSVVIGGVCAYALARMQFRGRYFILAFVLAVSMFPQISLIAPLYLLLREAGLINTYPGLVLPYLTFAMPLTIWLLVGYFRHLPPDLEEAAAMDGAGRLRTLAEIIAPLAAPGIATTAILTFVYCWNEFLFALSFTLGPERHTVPVAIALFRGQYQVPWGQILAAAVIASAPVVLLVMLFQRRIVQGLTSGAVKG